MKVFYAGLICFLSGCSTMHSTATRIGKIAPTKPKGCPVRFENLSHQEASQKYEQLGLVSLTGTSDQPQTWDGETRERLWPKVCEIGGSIVTPNGAMGGESYLWIGTGIIQFSVWAQSEKDSKFNGGLGIKTE